MFPVVGSSYQSDMGTLETVPLKDQFESDDSYREVFEDDRKASSFQSHTGYNLTSGLSVNNIRDQGSGIGATRKVIKKDYPSKRGKVQWQLKWIPITNAVPKSSPLLVRRWVRVKKSESNAKLDQVIKESSENIQGPAPLEQNPQIVNSLQ